MQIYRIDKKHKYIYTESDDIYPAMNLAIFCQISLVIYVGSNWDIMQENLCECL